MPDAGGGAAADIVGLDDDTDVYVESMLNTRVRIFVFSLFFLTTNALTGCRRAQNRMQVQVVPNFHAALNGSPHSPHSPLSPRVRSLI